MESCWALGVFSLLAVCALSTARTECMQVIGTLVCPSNPALAARVRMDLKDEDSLPLEIDDLMGRTWSSSNGSFVLSGCGADMGPFNTPDPYVYIEHKCASIKYAHIVNDTRKMQFALVKTFLPVILRIGKIFLDDSDA
uniref:Uncharacterized protein n=1 Tax=Parascaris univalens TaxID=6257 RepID=A0A915AIK7_PARUN